MTNFQPPSPEFIQARHHGGAQRPKAIVMHATVSSDNPGTARAIAQWWKSPSSPMSSAHYVQDPRKLIQCVGDHTVAYHCGYNTGSIGWEMCDEQVGPATRWGDLDSRRILKRSAEGVAKLCLAYDIEPKRPTIKELRRKGPHGIYGHNDSRLAFGHTTHSDPRDFPWPRFMRMVRQEVAKLREAAQPDEPKLPKFQRQDVKFAHVSMKYSDSWSEMRADCDKIFELGKDILTGTEAGGPRLRTVLTQKAEEHGYRLKLGKGDAWVAVKESFIKGRVRTGDEFVMKSSEGVGKHSHRSLPWISFETHNLGRITVGAGHYLTRGRVKGEPNYELNKRYARIIGDWADKHSKGSALVFYGGDQNIVDRTKDTFFGESLTSAWDELEKYEGTGHGNIDVIASYDADGRVVAESINAQNDREFKLFTDHYIVHARYRVRYVKAA